MLPFRAAARLARVLDRDGGRIWALRPAGSQAAVGRHRPPPCSVALAGVPACRAAPSQQRRLGRAARRPQPPSPRGPGSRSCLDMTGPEPGLCLGGKARPGSAHTGEHHTMGGFCTGLGCRCAPASMRLEEFLHRPDPDAGRICRAAGAGRLNVGFGEPVAEAGVPRGPRPWYVSTAW
jgi:hypothetical protein